jgi:Fe-S-cluster-containing hydrogenase component 2
MHKWNLIIDVARCENCHNCTLAVKDEHVDNDFPGYAAPIPRHGKGLIEIERKVRGTGHHVDVAYLPKMCNHCDDAPCLKASGADGAVRKRADGIVIVDPVKAKGRRDLVDACPYGAMTWNDDLSLPQTWIFDAHLLDQGWKLTDREMSALERKEGLRVLKPELGTKPRIFYKNLYRFDGAFVAGSVLARVKGQTECVSGADVVLFVGETMHGALKSDTFGDFKFDGLEAASGSYRLTASHPTFGSGEVVIHLESQAACAELFLSR